MTKIKFICIKPLSKGHFVNSIIDIKLNQIIEVIFFPEDFQIFFNNSSRNLSNYVKNVFFDSFIELNTYRELRINKILKDENIS
jgi:hypothetical protein